MSTTSGLMDLLEHVSSGSDAAHNDKALAEARVRRAMGDPARPTVGSHWLIRLSIPLMYVAALLILVPAAWALAYHAGIQVWWHDAAGADELAHSLTATWPLAIMLLCTATYFRTRRSEA